MNDWLAGLIGAIIGAVLAFVASWLTLRFQYKQLFATTVSASRKKWIDTVTDCFARYLAIAEALHELYSKESLSEDDERNTCKYKQQLALSERMITQRFTLNDDLQIMIKSAFLQMRNIIKQADNERFAAQCEYIENLGRQLLKVEWDRVKRESSGKKR